MSNDTSNQEAIVEHVENITFFNDKPGGTTTQADIIPLNPSLSAATAREAKIHEIRNFLARPVLIDSQTWTTGQNSNTVIGTYSNPGALFVQPQVRTKVSGFFAYKGTMVLTIQCNATRFMQGLALISYLPLKSHLSTRRVEVCYSNLISKTQLPCTTFDVSMDSEVSLVAPFVHAKPYVEVSKLSIDRTNDIGEFAVSVYSPLQAISGDTTVTLNVWAHLEDVDLEFPDAMISQSGRPVRRVKAGKETKGGASVSDQELSGSGVGPVSAVFGKISAVANVLSAIPTLSGIAGPASWLTAILSNAAAAAGWSNPSQSAPVGKIMPQRLAFSANVNGIDNSIKLAAFSDNEVEALPGFAGTDDDELSIARMVQRSAYFNRFSIDTTKSSGFKVASINITPGSFTQSPTLTVTGGKIAGVTLHTPLSYVANFFQNWRGSICIKFRIVKTEFHTGRIMASFRPGDYNLNTTMADTTSLYREVYDIADSNEINICIPYVSTKPWMSRTESVGTLDLFLLSTLRCPPTVSGTIYLIGEISGGDDIHFAVPRPFGDNIPIVTSMAAQCGGPLIQEDFDQFMEDLYPRPMISQGLGVNELSNNEPADMTMMPGGFSQCQMGNGNLSPERFCIGEAILSLRQLLKRSSLWLSTQSQTTASSVVDPFSYCIPYLTASAMTFNQAYVVDYFAAIGSCFALSRGGVRLKVYQPGVAADITVRGVIQTPSSDYANFSTTGGFLNGEVIVPVKVSMSGAVEVEYPQYTPSFARINWYGAGDAPSSGGSIIGSDYSSPFRAHFQWRDTTAFVALRQGSDDTDMGCFIGVLPTLRNASIFVPGSNPL